MPTDLYHVDSNNTLEQGDELELGHPGELDASTEEILQRYYPEGLSHWGENCIGSEIIQFRENARNIIPRKFFGAGERIEINELVSQNWMIETIFELVRLESFSNHPSRFQCWFGVKNVEDAKRFAEDYANPPVTIWEVNCDEFFTSDMRLLQEVDTFGESVFAAHKYWEKETYFDDPAFEALLVPKVGVKRKVCEYDFEIPAEE